MARPTYSQAFQIGCESDVAKVESPVGFPGAPEFSVSLRYGVSTEPLLDPLGKDV